jgi:hypothetical protein
VQREPGEEPRGEARDEEWDELGVWQGFGVAAAERVKRRRRKAGGTPGSYVRTPGPPYFTHCTASLVLSYSHALQS